MWGRAIHTRPPHRPMSYNNFYDSKTKPQYRKPESYIPIPFEALDELEAVVFSSPDDILEKIKDIENYMEDYGMLCVADMFDILGIEDRLKPYPSCMNYGWRSDGIPKIIFNPALKEYHLEFKIPDRID